MEDKKMVWTDEELEVVASAYRAGIVEVVEWIRRANNSGDFYYSFDQADLEAKRKEWGV